MDGIRGLERIVVQELSFGGDVSSMFSNFNYSIR